MYKDAYPSHKNKVEVSVVQLVVITLTLVVTFVIPASVISYYRNLQTVAPYTEQALALRAQQTGQTNQTGRVAGATTTSNVVRIPVLNIELNLNSQAGILMMGALLLAGVALIITIYLLMTPRKRLPPGWR